MGLALKLLVFLKYLFLLLSAIGLAASLFLYQQTQSFVANANTAIGTVTKISTRVSQSNFSRSEILFFANIQYTTNDAQTVTFDSRIGYNQTLMTPGRQVKVLYDPAEPQEAVIDSFVSIWFKEIIVGGSTFLIVLLTLTLIFITPVRKP